MSYFLKLLFKNLIFFIGVHFVINFSKLLEYKFYCDYFGSYKIVMLFIFSFFVTLYFYYKEKKSLKSKIEKE